MVKNATTLGLAFSFLLYLGAHQSFAQESSQMSQFIEWDVRHNREIRSDDIDTSARPVAYLEIPINHPRLVAHDTYMQWLKNERGAHHGIIVDFADYLPQEAKEILTIDRDGETFVRYFISPTDTYFYQKVIDYLNASEIPFRHYTADGAHRSQYLVRPTSSRSLIIINPENGYSLSLKPSTNKRTTRHSNDPYPTHWGYLNRRLSDYYHQYRDQLQHLDIAWEAAMVGFPNINDGDRSLVMQAQSVRLMDEVARGQTYEMSGFVATDSESAIDELAQVAGLSRDAFLAQAQETKGKGMAELGAILGWSFTSNHSQNFRWILDVDKKLTGKIRVLDLTDGHPYAPILLANGQDHLLEDWKELTANESYYNQAQTSRELTIRHFWRDSRVDEAQWRAYQAGLDSQLKELVSGVTTSVGGEKYTVVSFPSTEVAPHLIWKGPCRNLEDTASAAGLH